MLRFQLPRLLPANLICSMILLGACDDSGSGIVPFGSVAGVVGTVQGGGLVAVTIQLSRSGSAPRLAHTDINGYYRFDRVAPGTWSLVYFPPAGYVASGAPANPISINVAADAITNVAPLIFEETILAATQLIALSARETFGEVNGTVFYQAQTKDALGRPVPYVPVEWSVILGGGTLRTSTSNDGVFHYAEHTLGPGEGANTVTATAPTIAGQPKLTFITTGVGKRVWVVGGPSYYYEDVAPAFNPADVTVAAGQTVGWQWASSLLHNVVFEEAPSQPPGSETQADGTYFRKFETAGTFRYRCTQHSTNFTSGMVGVVKVL